MEGGGTVFVLRMLVLRVLRERYDEICHDVAFVEGSYRGK